MSQQVIDSINLQIKLIKQRDEFLREHPELLEFQDKINKTLDEVGDNPIERCRVIQHIMAQNAYILHTKIDGLIKYVEKSKIFERLEEIQKTAEGINNDLESR